LSKRIGLSLCITGIINLQWDIVSVSESLTVTMSFEERALLEDLLQDLVVIHDKPLK
jgi:hypothetical protein